MAKEKQNRPGKVLYQIGGLRIRLTPTGEFGIYAGKHLFKSYPIKDQAIKNALRIQGNKPTYHSLCKSFKQWKMTNK